MFTCQQKQFNKDACAQNTLEGERVVVCIFYSCPVYVYQCVCVLKGPFVFKSR